VGAEINYTKKQTQRLRAGGAVHGIKEKNKRTYKDLGKKYI